MQDVDVVEVGFVVGRIAKKLFIQIFVHQTGNNTNIIHLHIKSMYKWIFPRPIFVFIIFYLENENAVRFIMKCCFIDNGF